MKSRTPPPALFTGCSRREAVTCPHSPSIPTNTAGSSSAICNANKKAAVAPRPWLFRERGELLFAGMKLRLALSARFGAGFRARFILLKSVLRRRILHPIFRAIEALLLVVAG